MIRLTHRSLFFLLFGAPIWLVSPSLAWGYSFFVAGLLFLELALLPRKSKVFVKRVLPEHFVCGCPSQIAWELSLGKGILQDSFPGQEYAIQVNSEKSTQDTFTPLKRGKLTLLPPSLTLRGTFGLMDREYFFAFTEQIKVYPNWRKPKSFLISPFGQEDWNQMNRPRMRQGGGEFESLRAFVYGDDLRNVEWKISKKKAELICKTFAMEHDRHIAVLIDCGRKLGKKVGEHSLLEHSLSATLELCQWIKSKQDTFSLYAFSNKIEACLPKTDRKLLLRNALETIYQLQPQLVESDYWQVMAKVMHQLNKRSLIILFTDVLDTAGSLGLINNLARASQKHLVLCVIMKDQELEKVAAVKKKTYKRAAACHLLLEREFAIKQMRAKGIHVTLANPKNYISQVIQTYLNIREKI